MIADRQLSRNFRLSWWPCWTKATEADVAALQETVARVLQPTRDVWGAIAETSWKWWSSGCTLRDGAHGQTGGTVDVQPTDADTFEVFEWMKTHLLPAGYIGRLIYEPDWWEVGGAEPAGSSDRKVQGEHIHIATRRDMERLGLPEIMALVETEPGSYAYAGPGPMWGDYSGTYGDPIPLPGITASVSPGLLRWLLLGAGVGLALGREDRV